MHHPDTYLHGRRTPWAEAPAALRDWVLTRSGPAIGTPRDCAGGMATGVAAVVEGAERSVFVKAVDTDDNPMGGAMYRREAELAGLLPRHPTIPALLDAGPVDADGTNWWANVFQAAPGSPPHHPWQASDLARVLTAWADLAPTLHATQWSTSAGLSDFFTAWRSIAEDPTDPWQRRGRAWADREAALTAVVDGDDAPGGRVLSHIDLRADNLLVAPDNRDTDVAAVAFLDWAHPGTAAPWVDVALLLGDVVASGADATAGGDIDVIATFAEYHPDVDSELAITTISALGAFLHRRAHREEVNPAMPHRTTWARAASEQSLPFIDAHGH